MKSSWRRNLAAMWAGQLCAILGFSFVLPFLPLYIEQLGVKGTASIALWSGVIASVSSLSLAFFSPIWGAVADRRGRKPMVMRAMFGSGAVIAGMSFVQNVWELLGLRVLQGCLSGTVTASTALIASITPRESMGFALGMMQMAVFSGSSVGPYIGGVLVDSFGYRKSFFLTGIMLALGGLVVLFGVTEIFVPKPVVSGAPRRSIVRDLVDTVRDPRLAALIGVLALVQFGSMVVAPILPLFIQALAGPHESVATVAGQIFGVAGVSGALSSVVIGRISDRVGYRAILIGTTVIAGVIQGAMAFVGSTDQLLVLRAVVGLFMGGMLPTANALIAQAVAPDRRGAAFGAAASIASTGSALGPLVGSSIAATVGLRAVFPVTGFIFVAAGVALAFFQLESGEGRLTAPSG